MMLLFLVFLIFLTTSSLTYFGLSSRKLNKSYKESMGQLSNYEVKPLAEVQDERILLEKLSAPLINNLSGLLSKTSFPGRLAYHEKRLLNAGQPGGLSADKIIAVKVLAGFSMLAVSSVLLFGAGFSISVKAIWLLVFAVGGYYLPDLWLDMTIRKRRTMIERALPDTLDLLVICIEAGLGFDAALSKIIKYSQGPVAKEFAKVLYEIHVGIPRKEAFRNLVERNDIASLRNFSQAIIQADIFGISIGQVLRNQAEEVRTKGRQLAEEKAQKTTVKIVFPVTLCIFPAIFVIILGPAVIRLAAAFF